MPEITKYKPGMFSWVDMGTPDVEGAKKFYAGIFGWAAQDMPAGDDMTYTMFTLQRCNVAAIYGQREDQKGVPPMWLEYFTVESADKAAAKAQELGGIVAMEPMDVLDAGRQAMIGSPTGEFFAVWEPGKHIGAELVNEHGTLLWSELMTTDIPKSTDFYTNFFGWTAVAPPDMGGYVVFSVDGRTASGMNKFPDEMTGHPSYWSTCFAVDDCDLTCKIAEEQGAKILSSPNAMEGIGRYAELQDPQGASFAIMASEGQPFPIEF